MNKQRLILVTRLTGALILNSFLWLTFQDVNFLMVNNLTIAIARFFGILGTIVMFAGAIYLTFNFEQLKIIRKVNLGDLSLYIYTLILFISLFSFNLVTSIMN